MNSRVKTLMSVLAIILFFGMLLLLVWWWYAKQLDELEKEHQRSLGRALVSFYYKPLKP